MKTLSIVIVNYNVKKLLNNCLNSIFDNIGNIPSEIIVIDNRSSDRSQEMIKKKFPQVILIENNRNIGYARANNQGIKIASGEFVLLLNPDTIVLPKAIEKMIKLMNNNPKIKIVGPRLLNEDKSLQVSCDLFPILTIKYFCKVIINLLFSKKEKVGGFYINAEKDSKALYETDWLVGACLLIRNKVFKNIGLLDENFFLYGEDLEFCYRVKKSMKGIYYYTDAEIIHLRNSSGRIKFGKEDSYERIKMNVKAYNYFYLRHFGKIYRSMARMFLLIENILYSIFRRNKIRYLRYVLALLLT